MTVERTNGAEREISRSVAAIYKAYLDRGPERVQTTIGDDVVAVVLEGSLTKVERILAAENRRDSVRSIRLEYQRAMRSEIVATIEQITGRDAEALLSDHDVEADVAIEVVTLTAAPAIRPAGEPPAEEVRQKAPSL